MRKTFKKYFVPHKHNQYHPHLFRNTSVITILVVCTFLLGVSYGNYVFLHQTVLGANIATNVLVDLANQNRVENSIPALRRDNKLDEAATLKAEDMIQNKYFAHFAPDGTTPWYFINQAGYDFAYAGENLAINFQTPEEVDTAWMNSPKHRENLLNTNFRDLGIATKEGVYNGAQTVYVVQMFGAKAKEPEATQMPETEIKKIAKVETPIKTQPEKIKVITESPNFISAKNTSAVPTEVVNQVKVTPEPVKGEVAGVEIYSTWYDRFIFDSPYYIQLFFIVVIIIIAFGMALRMIIEYKRQHYKHLIISGLFLVATIFLALLNLNFINIF